MTADVRRISKEEWAKYFCTEAHIVCFEQVRSPDMDRIDFALLSFDKGNPSGFVTCREFDSETLYWQYGGAFPNIAKGVAVWKNYSGFRDYSLANYKRIMTYIENTNIPMLKMALQAGFRVIGTKTFKGDILLELLNEPD